MVASQIRDRKRVIPFAAEIGALGVVFGDIGTSPLYALKQGVLAVGGTNFLPTDVLGLLSLITWSIILSVTIKYVMLVLRADNDGEGGILALVTLLDLNRSAIGLRWYLLAAGRTGRGHADRRWCADACHVGAVCHRGPGRDRPAAA